MTDIIESEHWVEAGLAELGKSGIDGVRVEVLAQRLGVTKGGFYRRFKDRRALLNDLLDKWIEGRVEAIEQQLTLGDATPEQRLRAVVKLFAERVNAEGIAIELAIRQWARSDEDAKAAVAHVDSARQRATVRVFLKLGLTPKEAEVRAVLFYAFVFGQSMLFLDQPARKRAALIEACADVVLDAG